VVVEILSVAYGIFAMIGWGFADFLLKRVMRYVGFYKLLLYTQLIGLAPIILLALVFSPSIPSSQAGIALAIATGICSFSAMFFFFRAIETGTVSIVTPVASTSAIVAIALSFAFLGETLSLLQIVCIAMTSAGVLMVGMRSGSAYRLNAGIPLALVSALSAGLASVLIKLVSVDIGEIGTMLFIRVLVVLMLLMAAPFLKGPLPAETDRGLPLKSILIIGLIDFAAFFSFVVGLRVGMVAIVVPLSSAAPLITVVLAQTFLRERLIQIQKMALVLVIAGILLLSIASI